MRNESLARLEPALVGHWTLTLSDAWFLEPAGRELSGWAVVEWLGEAFLRFRSELDGRPGYELVIGHSDARDGYAALYHDDRGVSRLFQMSFGDGGWSMTREDPDFYQRFLAAVAPDRIEGRWEASEDGGRSWRKDFDLTFVRTDRPG
ncbi:hypothetical protein [Ornithinicoccus halotolerans]|uniref:hypothetical protein n=1 Tax=Ornithinicoccus halotolerans TaxID=1748220 RepID=UPI0012958008|nr:hypothetical protein [Ornithinicoccus halotolerans]